MRSTLSAGLVAPCLILAFVLGGTQAIAEIVEMDVEGIRNYSSYSGEPSFAGPRVGFGGATQPEAMEWLKQQGYAAVISLRLASEDNANVAANQAAAAEVGLTYIHLPLDHENPHPDIEQHFLTAAGKSTNQPVFIHCSSATRVAIMWMMGRALVDGVDHAEIAAEGARIAEKPDEALEFFNRRIARERN